MSETSDAVVVVVSEETGKISVCVNGAIERSYNQISLRERLYSELLQTGTQENKNPISKFFRRKDKDKEENTSDK